MNQPLRVVREGDRGTEEVASEQGDAAPAETFEAFVSANHAPLYAALCLLTHDRYEAEEIAQESFVRILERWDRVRDMENPAGYLFRTAMNLFRKRYRRVLFALRRAVSFVERDEGFEHVEARDVVIRAIGALPVDQRKALIVTSLLGYSSEEAGRILRIRPSTVRARATRARAGLRASIGEDR